jgi:antitoxin component YwqK of YwqJK toxin-antitoxin module
VIRNIFSDYLLRRRNKRLDKEAEKKELEKIFEKWKQAQKKRRTPLTRRQARSLVDKFGLSSGELMQISIAYRWKGASKRAEDDLSRDCLDIEESLTEVIRTQKYQKTPYGEMKHSSIKSDKKITTKNKTHQKQKKVKTIFHINVRNGLAYEVNSDIPYTGRCELTTIPNIKCFDSATSEDWNGVPRFINEMFSRLPSRGEGERYYQIALKELSSTGSFLNGKPDGIWRIIRYYQKEQWHETEIVNYNEGIKDGMWSVSHIKSPQTFLSCKFTNNVLNGLFICQNNGVKIREIEYKNGLMHGRCIYRYQENGQKEFECTLKNGFKHGICTKWYLTGQKKEECHYINGKLGKRKYWDLDGSLGK